GHAALDLVEDRRQVVEAVGQLALTVLAAAAHTCALGHALLDIGGDLLTVGRGDERPASAFSSKGPPRRICWARSTSRSTNSSAMDSSTMSRAPAEHTWPEWTKAALSALSRAASKSASAN